MTTGTHKELFYPVGAANFSRSFLRIDFNIDIDTATNRSRSSGAQRNHALATLPGP